MERVLPFEERFDKYDEWYEKYPGERLFKVEVNCLKKLIPDPGFAVEIGVGTGRFAEKLGIKFGLDPAYNPLKISKSRGIIVVQGDGRLTPFPDNTFETVFLIVTICFADNPEMLVKEASRILKPGGRVVLGLVPKNSAWGKYYLKLKAEGHFFYKYADFYTVSEVSSMLEESSFEHPTGLSTLFDPPPHGSDKEFIEDKLREDAGFVCITSIKPPGHRNL